MRTEEYSIIDEMVKVVLPDNQFFTYDLSGYDIDQIFSVSCDGIDCKFSFHRITRQLSLIGSKPIGSRKKFIMEYLPNKKTIRNNKIDKLLGDDGE